ncbi:MAG: hypothetical protein NTZ80_02255 [Patescibacteria group bacterium]|nr:hypothetical protein [Patescibacteria group bacterium]
MKTCLKCKSQFEVAPEDRVFHDKVAPIFNGQKFAIPEPEMCPECRLIHRLSFRNIRKIYKRKCDATGRTIISAHRPDVKFPVYHISAWHDDKYYDPLRQGRDFDFNRQFFEQFREMALEVPHPHAFVDTMGMENSEYCNGCNSLKNCYLCFNAAGSECCMYCTGLWYSRDCFDCRDIDHAELCYECVDGINCYYSFFSRSLKDCNNCHFCHYCYGCSNCFGCSELRNKEYYWFNEKLTRAEYEHRLRDFFFTPSSIEDTKKRAYEIYLSVPHKYANILSCEASVGNMLENCKNCSQSFIVKDAEDCKYCAWLKYGIKDCQDVSVWGSNINLAYNCGEIGNDTYSCLFTHRSWACENLIYCQSCMNVKNCFGCHGLNNHQEYCIFNKKYSKQEYSELIAKIISHMEKTGEWAKFFPSSISPFAYNESIAYDHFPITKEKAVQHGFEWLDEKIEIPKVAKIIPASKLPISISEVPDEILNWAIECAETKRPFIIQKAELAFYRRAGLPLPRLHPDLRYEMRLKQLNPLRLWHRSCANLGCSVEFETPFAPDRPEKIYCEECYQKTVF